MLVSINNQMPRKEKKSYADFILDNSSDIFNLRNQVENLYEKLTILAAKNQ